MSAYTLIAVPNESVHQMQPTVVKLTSKQRMNSTQCLKMSTSIPNKIVLKMIPITHRLLTGTESHNIVPRLDEKACGLFNTTMLDTSESDYMVNRTPYWTDTSSSMINQTQQQQHTPTMLSTSSSYSLSDDSSSPQTLTNLSILQAEYDPLSQSIEMTNINNLDMTQLTSFDPACLSDDETFVKESLQLDNDEMGAKLITPSIEKTIALHETGFKFSEDARESTTTNLTTQPLTASIITSDELEKLSNPLAKTLNFQISIGSLGDQFDFDELLKQEQMLLSSSKDNENNAPLLIDHSYSSSAPTTTRSASPSKKRSHDDLDADDYESSCSFTSSSTAGREKKRRTKGIYRAGDITNEEERLNYLERRKKNNISSKISRANKKGYYSQMDEKCEQMTIDNENLKEKIEKLEKANKMLKDFLIKRFVASK